MVGSRMRYPDIFLDISNEMRLEMLLGSNLGKLLLEQRRHNLRIGAKAYLGITDRSVLWIYHHNDRQPCREFVDSLLVLTERVKIAKEKYDKLERGD